jgi:hypothetical protein
VILASRLAGCDNAAIRDGSQFAKRPRGGSSMGTNSVSCPHCGLLLQDDGSLAGQVVGCPNCQGRLQMPPRLAPPQLPPATQPPTAMPIQQSVKDVPDFEAANLFAALPPNKTQRGQGSSSNSQNAILVGIIVIIALLSLPSIFGLLEQTDFMKKHRAQQANEEYRKFMDKQHKIIREVTSPEFFRQINDEAWKRSMNTAKDPRQPGPHGPGGGPPF